MEALRNVTRFGHDLTINLKEMFKKHGTPTKKKKLFKYLSGNEQKYVDDPPYAETAQS